MLNAYVRPQQSATAMEAVNVILRGSGGRELQGSWKREPLRAVAGDQSQMRGLSSTTAPPHHLFR